MCGKMKDLIDGYYLIRKNKNIKSSYSYECKECTIKRVRSKKKTNNQSSYSYECKICTIKRVKSKKKVKINSWEYPDW